MGNEFLAGECGVEGGLGGFEFGDFYFECGEFGFERLEQLVALIAGFRFGAALVLARDAGLGGRVAACGRCGFACGCGLSALFFHRAFLDVVADVSGKESGRFAGAKLEGFADHRIEERAVVRNDQHAAGVVGERALQDILRLHVEVVGRLVEDQEICRAQQHADECHARAFAAGEHADFFEDIVAAEKKAAEKVAGVGCGFARGCGFDGFENGFFGIELVGVVLREE